LHEKITSKEFRKDLYYRLAGKVLTIPSLRDITDDLPALIDHLAYKMGKAPLKRDETIHYFAERLNELEGYHWPGNIRELANYVEFPQKIILIPNDCTIFSRNDSDSSCKDNNRSKKYRQKLHFRAIILEA